MRITARLSLGLGLTAVLTLGTAGAALASPESPHANCIGVGSSYAARVGIMTWEGAVFNRADISHLVQALFPVPGEEARHIAHDIERGSLQSCLAPLAALIQIP